MVNNNKSDFLTQRGKKLIKIILINLLIFISLIVFLEISTRIYAKYTRGSSTAGLSERKVNLKYKPFVMFGPDWDTKLKNTQKRIPDSVFHILLVGGSVAQAFPTKILEDEFSKTFNHLKCKVTNIGVGSFNARQEAIVTTLWGIELKPDLIITLTGANDMAHRIRSDKAGTFVYNESFELILKKPVLAPFVEALRSSQFFYGINRIKERNAIQSTDTYRDCIPVLVSAQRSINAVAKGMNAKRIIVLQPHVAFKNPLAQEEKDFTIFEYRKQVMIDLYNQATVEMEKLSEENQVSFLDGNKIFINNPDRIFTDDVHFIDDQGYQLVAERIAQLAKADQLIDKVSNN